MEGTEDSRVCSVADEQEAEAEGKDRGNNINIDSEDEEDLIDQALFAPETSTTHSVATNPKEEEEEHPASTMVQNNAQPGPRPSSPIVMDLERRIEEERAAHVPAYAMDTPLPSTSASVLGMDDPVDLSRLESPSQSGSEESAIFGHEKRGGSEGEDMDTDMGMGMDMELDEDSELDDNRSRTTNQATSSSCSRCGDIGHGASSCPEHWRRYIYYSDSEREAELNRRGEIVLLKGWQQQAFGAVYRQGGGAWCYNCAAQGHYGDDCPTPPRHSHLDAKPSAFSRTIGLLDSPFASSYVQGWEPESIYFDKDDDDPLPFAEIEPEFKVGKNSRQNNVRKARAKDAKAQKEEGEDEDDWFANPDKRRPRIRAQVTSANSEAKNRPNPKAIHSGNPTGPYQHFSPIHLGKATPSAAAVYQGNSNSNNYNHSTSHNNNYGSQRNDFYSQGNGGGNVHAWGNEYDSYERSRRNQNQHGGGGGYQSYTPSGGNGGNQRNQSRYRGGY